MIKIEIFKNANGDVIGFDCDNHGDPIVCAAVSVLVLNTINSIEHFTTIKFDCDLDEERGGYLSFRLKTKPTDKTHDANLLLAALNLGIESIARQYPKDLKYKEVITQQK